MTELFLTPATAFSHYQSLGDRTLSKDEIIQCIQAFVPPGAPEPTEPQIIAALQDLTQRLIHAYQADGLLHEDPFGETWVRSIHLYEAEVRQKLEQQVVAVTGGEGCVGQCLIQKLVKLGVKRIVSIDKARCETGGETRSHIESGVKIVQYAVDIRDYSNLQAVFVQEKPSIVFHLGAQRLPWLAEIQVRETITTNIFGTQNVIRVCEATGVQHCIVSSTGKASRYITGEVYAASKKMMEWQLAIAAQKGSVTYGMVRFTHMLNNSSFCEVYDNKIANNAPVNVHAPHRYVVGQNLIEATHLLLNSLIISKPQQLNFVLCRNLGWPVETLEVALYKILRSGQPNFIYFSGVAIGYEESFFRGQVDWRNPAEINTLINVVECQTKTFDAVGHMIIADVPNFSKTLLNKHMEILKTLATDSIWPEAKLKPVLAKAISEISGSMLALAPASVLLQILNWGMDINHLKADGTAAAAFQDILERLVKGLSESLKREASSYTPDEQVEKIYLSSKMLGNLPNCFQTLDWKISEEMAIAIAKLEDTLLTLQQAHTNANLPCSGGAFPSGKSHSERILNPVR